VSPQTEVIDMRTPATASLPIITRWPASHARRRPSPDATLRLVQAAALTSGWGTLAVLLVRWCLTVPVV